MLTHYSDENTSESMFTQIEKRKKHKISTPGIEMALGEPRWIVTVPDEIMATKDTFRSVNHVILYKLRKRSITTTYCSCNEQRPNDILDTH